MKYLKWIIAIIALIIVAYLLLCLVGPKSMDVSKSQTIKSSPSHVFNLIQDLEAWETWNPYQTEDSTMVVNFPGKKEGLGASYTWKGDLSGSGSMEIVELDKNKYLKTKLMFAGHDGHSNGEWTLVPKNDNIEVTWSSFSDYAIPYLGRGAVLLSGFKNKQKAKYARALDNIKAIAEERAKGIYSGYHIKNVNIPEMHYLTQRATVDSENIQSFYARNLPVMATKMVQAGGEMQGMPSGLFYSWDYVNQKIDMAAAIPIKNKTSIKGYSDLSIPEGKAVQIDYYGDYHGTSKAHEAIRTYLKDQEIFHNYPVVEEYVTDPGLEKDQTKWLTRISYYISEEN